MASLRRSIVASLLFTVFGGPGILLVLGPWWTTRFQIANGAPPGHVAAGWALIGFGLIPLLESIVRFIVVGRGALVPAVPTKHLVVSGLYRYVRNPMYVGVMTTLCGEALLFWSRGVATELAGVAVAIELFVLLYEEPRLTRTFGEEYRIYSRNVRRWIPRITPWRP